MERLRDRMERDLRIRGYAPGTIQLYLGCMLAFARYHNHRPVGKLSLQDIYGYQHHLTRDRKVAWSTFNVHVAALRFFYRFTLTRDWRIDQIPYQKKARRLPQVLAPEEVEALFAAATHPKYRTLFMTMYAAGLRPSEARHLKVEHIESWHMAIRVEQGKGRKDRYLMLSPRLLEALRDYWRHERPRPFLFPGQDPSMPISSSAVEKMLQRAARAAGIRKHVTPHTLRHCFATHLVHAGVDIRTVQTLLGHRSLRSTEIYTHIAGDYLQTTPSPLDLLSTDTIQPPPHR